MGALGPFQKAEQRSEEGGRGGREAETSGGGQWDRLPGGGSRGTAVGARACFYYHEVESDRVVLAGMKGSDGKVFTQHGREEAPHGGSVEPMLTGRVPRKPAEGH